MREYISSTLEGLRSLDVTLDTPTIVVGCLLLLDVVLTVLLVVHAIRKGATKLNIACQFIAAALIGMVFAYWLIGLWLLMRASRFPTEHLRLLAIEFVVSALVVVSAIICLAICRNKERKPSQRDDDDDLRDDIFPVEYAPQRLQLEAAPDQTGVLPPIRDDDTSNYPPIPR